MVETLKTEADEKNERPDGEIEGEDDEFRVEGIGIGGMDGKNAEGEAPAAGGEFQNVLFPFRQVARQKIHADVAFRALGVG